MAQWTEADLAALLSQGQVREMPWKTSRRSQDRVDSPRRLRSHRESEKSFLGRVSGLAAQSGWLVYHTWRSERSEPGFPDLVFTNGKEVVFAELKTARGKVTVEQARWLALLRQAGCQVYLWRPRDWPVIQNVLTGQHVSSAPEKRRDRRAPE